MTPRERAQQIISYAKFLEQDDAINMIEITVKTILVEGELAGIEQARQSIQQLQTAE